VIGACDDNSLGLHSVSPHQSASCASSLQQISMPTRSTCCRRPPRGDAFIFPQMIQHPLPGPDEWLDAQIHIAAD
jgi:hypothetical protein